MSNHHRARLCPYCRAINGRDAESCVRCERKLPGPVVTAVLELASAAGATGAPVTALFALVNFAVFAAMHTGRGQMDRIWSGASTARLVSFGAILPALTHHEAWRLVSASFLHIGILHIAMNMYALIQFGRDAERIVGSARYAVAYVLTGVAGFWASSVWGPQGGATAGASASLFGLLGMLLGWLFARRDPRWKQFATYTVASALLFGFVMPRVNNIAHVGGLVAGAALGVLFALERRPYKRAILANVLGTLAVLSVFASFVLARLSPVSRYAAEAERERQEQADD